MPTVYAGTFGLKIQITMGLDLTGNTGVTYNVSYQNLKATWTATVDTASTGITHYTTIDGDLNTPGLYSISPSVTFSGKKFYGVPVTFTVL